MGKRPIIYDCFTFFNELDLLELRLHELAGTVDRFVLVEAPLTFTRQPKPLYFHDNRERFAEFSSKIIHVVVNDSPDTPDPWVVERFQRNCISRGLAGCRPDDFVMVSDLDEIPRATAVEKMSRQIPFHDDPFSNAIHNTLNSWMVKGVFHRKGFRRRLRLNHPFVWKFQQSLYKYFLNCQVIKPPFCHGTRLLRFRDFSCAEEIRHSGYKTVPDGGWHFSFMGGTERIQEKLAAYAHQENNRPEFTDARSIEDRIIQGLPLYGYNEPMKFVCLDRSFPDYVVRNQEKFAKSIKPL